MHRREPDYGNAKYWFRHVGSHAIFPELSAAARELIPASLAHPQLVRLRQSGSWDPFRFVDLCEELSGSDSDEEDVCQRIARVEWQLLFDHCYREGR